jgi:general secretion pathway protein G
MPPNKDTGKDRKMKISTTTIFLYTILLISIGGCKKGSTIGDKHQLARAKMTVIEAAIVQYFLDCSQYPASLEELLKPPAGLEGKWKGPYLKDSQLLDPWGNKYIYVPEGKVNPGSFDIISYGADGSPGGEGDNEDIYND